MTASTRWRFHDPALLWLFPATYTLHLLEEGLATAPILLWHARLEYSAVAAAFLVVNAFGLALMIAGVHLAGRHRRYHWVAAALASAVLLNTAGHLVGSARADAYSAGLMTAMILWIPLGMLMFLRVATQSTRLTLWGGAAVGVAIEVAVVSTMRVLSATLLDSLGRRSLDCLA